MLTPLVERPLPTSKNGPQDQGPYSGLTHIMTESFAYTAARTALSLIVSESNVAGASGDGFEAIERSASEALVDIYARYVRTIGRTARAAAQHAGRSESNMADLFVGLGAVRGAQPQSLATVLSSSGNTRESSNGSATKALSTRSVVK